MTKEENLYQLGAKVWNFRKENGFSKKLPEDLQIEAADLCKSGMSSYAIGKALGIPVNSVNDWVRRLEKEKTTEFSELNLVEKAKPNMAIKLSTTVQGCDVEISGTDYSLLQRLLRRLGN